MFSIKLRIQCLLWNVVTRLGKIIIFKPCSFSTRQICLVLVNRCLAYILVMNGRCTTATFFPHGATAPTELPPPPSWGLNFALRHTTHSRIPLDLWSARHRDHYHTTHNTQKREISMLSAEFEPAILAGKRRSLTPDTAQPPGLARINTYTKTHYFRFWIWKVSGA
jgi:hypothetical protein